MSEGKRLKRFFFFFKFIYFILFFLISIPGFSVNEDCSSGREFSSCRKDGTS